MAGVIVQMQNLPNLQIILELSRDYEDSAISRARKSNFISFCQEQLLNDGQKVQNFMSQVAHCKFQEKTSDTEPKSSLFKNEQIIKENDGLFSMSINYHKKSEQQTQTRKSVKQIGSSIYKKSLTDNSQFHKRGDTIDFEDEANGIPEEGFVKQMHNQQDKFLLRKVNTIASNFGFDEYEYQGKLPFQHSKTMEQEIFLK